MSNSSESSFENLKLRLDEIVELVNDETMPLDEALKLYEEAVSIGLEATNLLEQNIAQNNEAYEKSSTEDNNELPDSSN